MTKKQKAPPPEPPTTGHMTEAMRRVEGPLRERLHEPIAKVTGAWQWFRNLKPYRVYLHFSYRGGWILAGGITYKALFAMFAAIYVGFSVAAIWLAGRPDLLNQLYTLINTFIPNLFAVNGQPGAIDPDDLVSGAFVGWTGVIVLIGLIWTAIGWLYYSRMAVRSIFDVPRDPTNYVLQKIYDLFLGLAFGVLLIIGAIANVGGTVFLTTVLGWFGFDQESFLVLMTIRFGSFLVVMVLNTITLASMYRVLSRIFIPWGRLLGGSLLGAIALGVLQVLGGLLFGTTTNPLLASFIIIIGLLLWLNISSVIILLAASWIAVGMADNKISAQRFTPQQLEQQRVAAALHARTVLAENQVRELQNHADSVGTLFKPFAIRRADKAREAFRQEFGREPE